VWADHKRKPTGCARIDRPLSSKAILVASILVAAALRLPDLAARPMHADEAVHADKLGTLLEGGGYAYDPSEYHGPTLYYMTLPSAWLRGEHKYVDLDEVTLRAVPALLGVLLVAATFGARHALGAWGAAIAAILTALSPAMVYYSRYYIHEMALVLFTFGALIAMDAYRRNPRVSWALATGACVGLMLATKETASLALGSMLLAFGLMRMVRRRSPTPATGLAVRRRDLGFAALAAVVVAVLLFTAFLSHPEGLLDSVKAYQTYVERARAASWHVHPWHYYLGLLLYHSAEGTPVWSEALIVVLAVVGGATAWTARGVPGADPVALRFLSLYTVILLAVYSAIPYKTPWCVLGFLHGMILLAGIGAVFLLQWLRGATARTLGGFVLVAATAHLGWEAWAGSFRFAADPGNPWVYAHTSTDVFTIVGRLEDLAAADPRGLAMPIQVMSRENLWPLPWYLRRNTAVEWWTGVPDDAPAAPVILITPEMEDALVRKLYDLPPPGERELYVGIFDRPVQLRPGVEIRGYAANTLWSEFRQLEAEAELASRRGGGE